MSKNALNLTWERKPEYAHCGMFTKQHQNVPHGFNPHYKPYASEIMNRTYESLEAEGIYQSMTLKERQDKNVFRNRYDQIMRDYEHELKHT